MSYAGVSVCMCVLHVLNWWLRDDNRIWNNRREKAEKKNKNLSPFFSPFKKALICFALSAEADGD